MYLHQLVLHDFRNYADVTLTLPPGLILVTGANAQGKSNLLEAMAMLAYGQSPRTSQEADVVRWGATVARVRGEVRHATGEMTLAAAFAAQGPRRLQVNGQPVRRLADYVGRLPAVYFGVEDLALVRGVPADRRKFIDRLLGQLSPRYFLTLQQYAKTLQQRNSWLKSLHDGRRYDPALGEMWREQLASLGGLIIAHRLRLLRQLEQWALDAHSIIVGGPQVVSLGYAMAESPEVPDAEGAGEHLRALLQRLEGRERARGQTLAGPHRDDLLIRLEGREARRYASQGQQRSLVLSLKLAEVLLLRALKDDSPMVLFDDVLAELDRDRQHRLVAAIPADVQTVITATEPPPAVAGRRVQRIWVEEGAIVRQEAC
jgi:DNA replication and repair protein RecF